jgi:hypothetical protein
MGKRPVWKKLLRIAFVLLLLTAVCLGIWSVFIEPNRLVIHREAIKIDAWPKNSTVCISPSSPTFTPADLSSTKGN